MESNTSFKKVIIQLLIILSFISSFYFTFKINPEFGTNFIGGDFSDFTTLGLLLLVHLVLIIVISLFLTKKRGRVADSELLGYKELSAEQKRMENERVFLTKAGFNKQKNHYYSDKSALALSRNVKLSTEASYEHTILFGPTGSGKSAAFFIPILKQFNDSSVVVTDPKGELCQKTRKYLEYNGFRVVHFDFNNPETSAYYSLLGNCQTHSDVAKLAESILSNGSGGGSDDNWVKMSKPLFLAFLYEEFDNGDKSLSNVIKNLGKVGAKSDKLDEFFEEASDKAIEAYEMFKGSMGSDATVGSIFTTINGKIEVFTYEKVQKLSEYSSFSADDLRLQKTALFVSYPEDEAIVYSPFIASFFYQILSNVKGHYSVNQSRHNGAEGLGVVFLLDEFANIGTLPELDTFLSTIRSKKMAVFLGVQSFDQIKVRYKDRTNTIVENCKTKIILPGTTGETAKFFSELVGEEEYKQVSVSSTKAKETSMSQSDQKKMILSQDQIRRMKRNDVIFVSDNLKPVKDIKNLYYITKAEQKIMKLLIFSKNERSKMQIAKKIASKLNLNKEEDAFEKKVSAFEKKQKRQNQKTRKIRDELIAERNIELKKESAKRPIAVPEEVESVEEVKPKVDSRVLEQRKERLKKAFDEF